MKGNKDAAQQMYGAAWNQYEFLWNIRTKQLLDLATYGLAVTALVSAAYGTIIGPEILAAPYSYALIFLLGLPAAFFIWTVVEHTQTKWVPWVDLDKAIKAINDGDPAILPYLDSVYGTYPHLGVSWAMIRSKWAVRCMYSSIVIGLVIGASFAYLKANAIAATFQTHLQIGLIAGILGTIVWFTMFRKAADHSKHAQETSDKLRKLFGNKKRK